MPITLCHTSSSQRDSTACLFSKATDILRGPDYSKILYLAPDPPMLRHAERIFRSIAGDCYIPPVMVTIPQLARRLFSWHGDRNLVPDVLIPAILSVVSGETLGYSCHIAHVWRELAREYPGRDVSGISTEIRSVFARCGIPDNVTTRAMKALEVVQNYRDRLLAIGAADEHDAIGACPSLVRNGKIDYDVLIVDGFVEPSKGEEEIIAALIGNARETLISLPGISDYSSLSSRYSDFINRYVISQTVFLEPPEETIRLAYCAYPGVEEEVEGIARDIKHRYLSGGLSDLDRVLVVFPELKGYEAMVPRIFRKYGIPFSLQSEKALAEMRPFDDLLSLLDSVSDDYPRLEFSQFLASPFFRKLPSVLREFVPSLSIASAFAKGKAQWESLVRNSEERTKTYTTTREASPTIARDLAKVFRKLSRVESMRSSAPFGAIAESITRLLTDLDFDPGHLPAEGKEHVLELLARLPIMDVFSGGRPVTLRFFTEVLRHCLMSTSVSFADTPGVRVLRFADAQGCDADVVYFGGLRDGDFPSQPDIDHFLPDSVRTELGLMNLQKRLVLQKAMFRRLLSVAKHYSLSYAMMDGDRRYLPSSFLARNEALSLPSYGILSREEVLLSKHSGEHGPSISEITGMKNRRIQSLFGKNSALRVTDIDSYRACPRKFFIENVLALKPIEIATFEVEAALLGTILHRIMQALVRGPLPDYETLWLRTDEILRDILAHVHVDEYWKAVLRETMRRVLPEICAIERDIAEEGYVFMASELSLTGEVLPGVTLTGKIDRVDRKVDRHKRSDVRVLGDEQTTGDVPSPSDNATVQLLDYKTGAYQLSGKQIRELGSTLQLPLYAVLLKQQGFVVERAGIYSLKDLSLTWIPNRDDRRAGCTMDDYGTAGLAFLKTTVEQMRRGEFRAVPLTEQTCRNCPERPYCPFIQKPTA